MNRFGVIACAGLVLLLSACGSSVNQANYDKLETDMTLAQVEALLGKAHEADSVGVGPLSGTSAVWRDEKAGVTIRIQFVNGKLRGKQFAQQTAG